MCREYIAGKLQLLALLLTLPLLNACSDDLAELDKRLSESNNPTPSPGVYVKLSSDLQQAIALPESQTTVQLRIASTDGSADREQTLSIAGDTASDNSELAEGEYRYHVQIFHSAVSTNAEPLLLAAASKTSSAKRIEFSATELQTSTAFDIDGDGSIDEAEKTALNFDFDGDTRVNLAEVIEGGLPKNSDPTLLSPVILSIAEGYGRGDSFYTAVVISPRRDANGAPQTISYGIRNSETDPRLVDLITIDADSGELFINQGQELRYYPQGDNSYTITLTATDSKGTIALPPLTLTVTDIFNLTVQASIKALNFQWDPVSDSSGVAADYYKLLEDINGDDNFKQVSIKDPDGTLIPLELIDTQYKYNLSLHLTSVNANTRYKLEAYRRNTDPQFNASLIKTSTAMLLDEVLVDAQGLVAMVGYFKATHSVPSNKFGISVALSADGNTLAVGSDSSSNFADHSNDCAKLAIAHTKCEIKSGTVYIFYNKNNRWLLQAHVTPTKTNAYSFGYPVTLSADGNTLAVGAHNDGGAVNGVLHQSDIAPGAMLGDVTGLPIISFGAVFVYRRKNEIWQPQAYIKASKPSDTNDLFAWSVSLSADGNTLAVGAPREDSGTTGINGGIVRVDDCYLLDAIFYQGSGPLPTTLSCKRDSGVVYVFQQQNERWQQQAYIKASNANTMNEFGKSVTLSADGNLLVVGAPGESNSERDNGEDAYDCALFLQGKSPPGTPTNLKCSKNSGAVYIFRRNGTDWAQEANLKFGGYSGRFGYSVTLSGNGSTLAAGIPGLMSGGSGNLSGNYLSEVRAFRQENNLWVQMTSIFPPYRGEGGFGASVALSADGQTLAVGNTVQDSAEKGIQNKLPPSPNTPPYGAAFSGAAYIFRLDRNGEWQRKVDVKASNSEAKNKFGKSLALSSDGSSLVVGASRENSNATDIGGVQTNDCTLVKKTPPETPVNCNIWSGAVYMY